MAENYTYTPDELFATDADIRTQTGVLVNGQNLAKWTPVKLDAAYKYTALTAAGDKAVGITIAAVDASAGDAECIVYTAGDFILHKLVGWPGAITTDLNKKAVFAGTPIQLLSYPTGQLPPSA